jgi:hypothetical protein
MSNVREDLQIGNFYCNFKHGEGEASGKKNCQEEEEEDWQEEEEDDDCACGKAKDSQA